MTRLEQIEYRLDYLLSRYPEKKNEAGYKIQIAILIAERNALLRKPARPMADVD